MLLLRSAFALAAAATLAACASGSSGASAPAPAAPAASAAAPAAATAPDFTGDWEFTAQMRESTVSGSWRLTRTEAGYTGILASSLGHSAPIRSFTSRGRSFTLTFEVDNEPYTITGVQETQQTIHGTLNFRGGIGRLQASRR